LTKEGAGTPQEPCLLDQRLSQKRIRGLCV